MSEDRFNNQVRSIMANYQPEVPASVYGAMRKKMWWSNFTRLSATRFNIWYLALLLSGATAAWAFWPQASTSDSAATTHPIVEQPESQPVVEITTETPQVAESVQAESNTQITSDVKKDGMRQSVEATNTVAPVNATELTTTIAEVETNKPVEEEKVEEPQTAKSGAKRGLKMKTYSDGQQKK